MDFCGVIQDCVFKLKFFGDWKWSSIRKAANSAAGTSSKYASREPIIKLGETDHSLQIKLELTY